MYISRVEIDKSKKSVLKKLTHLGSYHAWVEESFPKEFELKIRTRKLWRIDKIDNKEYLIIVSEEKPDLKAMEKFGVKGSAHTKDYQSFLDSLEVGSKMMFRAILNPIISVPSIDKSARGKARPCTTKEEQVNYLVKRSETNGFKLENDTLQVLDGHADLFKKTNKGVRSVTFLKASYEGVLTVTDLDAFKKALTNGLGKNKAYGFGLMTVIPLG